MLNSRSTSKVFKMHDKFSYLILILTVFFIIGGISITFIDRSFGEEATPRFTYEIINTYTHDRAAFTQGLIYSNGVLHEGTGLYGYSSIRIVDLDTGEVLNKYTLSAEYFGEGITIVDDQIYQLTWRENTAFIYNKQTLEPEGNFSYKGEGWGLTFDGNNLIMSNGTQYLVFIDPESHQITSELQVLDNNNPVTQINELEFIKGEIYANIWYSEEIAIINPQTGKVRAWINLTDIENSPLSSQDVLNGIAYDPINDHLFITGKNWPHLFELELISNDTPDQTPNQTSNPPSTTSIPSTETPTPTANSPTTNLPTTDINPASQIPSTTTSLTPSPSKSPPIPEFKSLIMPILLFGIFSLLLIRLYKKKTLNLVK